ncbi:MAG: T9SS C-terminal target domain-containing protein [Candidatus Zixiibacteriota bacterium]|nr:MAG: T9SS C-terminal target domain-containing protein [candidate division Zixibacteria bacterium]
MKSLPLPALCALLCCAVPAAAQVWQSWEAAYNGSPSGSDLAYSVAVDPQGNVLVTGESDGPGSLSDIVTLKYDPAGFLLWEARYDGPAQGEDRGLAVAADSGGNVYVTGTSAAPGTGLDFVTLKYSPAGTLLWHARYDGPAGGTDRAAGLAVDDSGVVVCGESQGLGTGYDFAVIRYAEGGTVRWVQRYDGPAHGDDYPAGLALDGSGRAYVTGASPGAGTGGDWATLAFDEQGLPRWTARFNSAADFYEEPAGLAVDSAGWAVVTGYSEGFGTRQDFVTIRYDADGQQQWLAHYDGPGSADDIPTGVAYDPYGNVIVTGRTWDETNLYDFTAVKYTPQGQQVWLTRQDGPGGYDSPNAMALDAAGSAYLAGFTNVASGANYFVVKFDASGGVPWTAMWSSPGGAVDLAQGVAVDALSRVFVTGSRWGVGNWDYGTVCYSQGDPPSVTLTPVNPPIQIAAGGGGFDFQAALSNPAATPQWCDAWIMVRLPDQAWFGPVLGPLALELPGGAALSRLRTQTVPASAAAGEYYYCGCVGDYPGVAWDSSGFSFSKLGAGDGGLETGENWPCTGDPFPGERGSQTALLPSGLTLSASPNPFNPTTALSYELRAASHVSLRVYDTAGREVAELVDGWREAGSHEVTFDAYGLAGGIYFTRLEAGETTLVMKLILLK